MDGKMPDLIKKKIDHRLDCHHYHCAAVVVSLDVGQSGREETPCPSTMVSILIEPEEEEVTIRE